ncbi:helix-turn-helix domain-containing protein [Bacillus cereus]|uniref:helix-turn-helix domain-containing protein n=1 Tax=Bacillus cereus TaxID=1396 RepID=UPI0008476167|nr:helix-turn-helix transcriptional regulator [Bacillus cereus]AOM07580.1 Helix-turn-helix domain protein [Bacillus cereus]MCC2366312.1 helix-turn-helix domain-containing protein [Bacillus cereus]MCC2447947.1 helix-turn-helix domain-containing protein [Bacillus cereus]MCC2490908.1 helix-turn-helix domain-containing protein [Bacillus cereus]MCU5624077.1 helix-turn-helix domain-containing protein [Bacillus cereus]
MLKNLGEKIRELRIQKGFGLNEFAKILDISPSYLSQLETGKTENINFTLLQRLQEELAILPLTLETNDETFSRLNRAIQQIQTLQEVDAEAVEFLIHNLETSIDWFLHKKLR